MEKKLDVGAVLGETFQVYAKNFPVFVGIGLLVMAPAIALQAVLQASPAASALAIVGTIVTVVLGYVAQGAMTYGVFQHTRGKPVEFGNCVSVGISRFAPLFVVGLCLGIMVTLGMLACLVPGIVLVVLFFVAIPATVIEKTGLPESFQRSLKLTEGNRWQVFAVFLVIAITSLVVSFLPTFAAGLLGSTVLQFVAYGVGTVLTAGIQAAAPTLVYLHLRRIKETLDLEEVAGVFA